MDDEIDTAMVRVRADTAGFARDVAAMRGELESALGAGADRAGLRIEGALLRAVKTGKLGFEELRGVALSALEAIAKSALRTGLEALIGGGGAASGGLGAALASLVGGAPGRATGGPVSPGRAYMVGERGPELFVPTASGRVEAAGGGVREVRVAITVNTPAGTAPAAMAQSARQVARAVKAALAVE